MKYKPYQEIMDFDKECKEYLNLCKNKSEKYTYYTDWEKHITKCVSTISKERDLYNFKHYCIRRARTTAKMPEILMSCMVLFITLIVDILIDDLPVTVRIVMITIFIGIILKHDNEATNESHFFSDIIEIIEKVERERFGVYCKD